MSSRTDTPITTPPPIASVIVPSFRGAERLPSLLDSLDTQQVGTPPFEVIVVIDGVDDGSSALVEAEDRIDVRAILFPENRGRVAALNTGFAAARGDVLIRCDDDLRVPPGFVASHVAAHRQSKEPIGVVGLTRDLHVDSPYSRAYGIDAAERSFVHASSRESGELWRHWAANCSITRETWERVGPYDMRYRTYGWEDVDYGYRLHAAGVRLVREPGTTADHLGPARSARGRAGKAFDSGSARALFQELHPEAGVEAPSAGSGIWGAGVAAAAVLVRSRKAVDRFAGAVDRALPHVPSAVGRKLVALSVEGAGLAGAHHGAVRTRRSSADGSRPRIAIAHDYLTQRGGAERVVLELSRAFPDAEIHTLFYAPDQTYPEFRDRVIHTSPLNRIGPFRRDPRLALPLLAPMASLMRIDADVVIASSSGWAHGFPTTGRKIVYCHSPARWLYLADDYLGDAGRLSPKRLLLAALTRPRRRWDRAAARTAETYLANSTVVKERIRQVYGIEAETVFPPFSPDVVEGEQTPIDALPRTWAEGGHYLVVSRLQPYKHVDAVIEAFRSMPDKRLLVIGKGPLRDALRAMAPANVILVEGLSDAKMRWAYANAKALIAASYEDFGLTPLEAGAHGVPTLALRAGGYLDTVAEKNNGWLFDKPSAEDIAEAINTHSEERIARSIIRSHANRFGPKAFRQAIIRIF